MGAHRWEVPKRCLLAPGPDPTSDRNWIVRQWPRLSSPSPHRNSVRRVETLIIPRDFRAAARQQWPTPSIGGRSNRSHAILWGVIPHSASGWQSRRLQARLRWSAMCQVDSQRRMGAVPLMGTTLAGSWHCVHHHQPYGRRGGVGRSTPGLPTARQCRRSALSRRVRVVRDWRTERASIANGTD
jgi:hypothetical protein